MLFKHRKEFKPYQCPRLRTKSWPEKMRDAILKLDLLLVSLGEILFHEIGEPSDNRSPDAPYKTSDWLDDDSGMHGLGDSAMFGHDDDDMIRGQWDPTSMYYSICHSDDYSTDTFHTDDHCFTDISHHDW